MRPFQFIGDKDQYDTERAPEPSFGRLPFDHYVVDKWDVESTQTESQQRDDLVKSWLALGAQGRLTYHDKRLAAWESRSQHFSVPPAIPKHLQTPQQRWEATTLMLPTMWIRTWFGNENVTRAEADAAYFKLCEHVDTEKSDFIDGNWAFEDDEEFMDVSGAPTTAGVTPKYVNALFRRYPDVVDPGGRPTERDRRLIEEGVLVGVQRILMIVADKIACETGAVLLIGINDFGGMLPKRLRVKPDDVSYFTATWENNGQDLDESFSEGDTGELVWYEGDDAWVPMLVLTDNKPTIQSITT